MLSLYNLSPEIESILQDIIQLANEKMFVRFLK